LHWGQTAGIGRRITLQTQSESWELISAVSGTLENSTLSEFQSLGRVSALLIAGVDGVAEAVADEVDAEDCQEDHDCGRDPDPGAVLEHIQAAR